MFLGIVGNHIIWRSLWHFSLAAFSQYLSTSKRVLQVPIKEELEPVAQLADGTRWDNTSPTQHLYRFKKASINRLCVFHVLSLLLFIGSCWPLEGTSPALSTQATCALETMWTSRPTVELESWENDGDTVSKSIADGTGLIRLPQVAGLASGSFTIDELPQEDATLVLAWFSGPLKYKFFDVCWSIVYSLFILFKWWCSVRVRGRLGQMALAWLSLTSDLVFQGGTPPRQGTHDSRAVSFMATMAVSCTIQVKTNFSSSHSKFFFRQPWLSLSCKALTTRKCSSCVFPAAILAFRQWYLTG